MAERRFSDWIFHFFGFRMLLLLLVSPGFFFAAAFTNCANSVPCVRMAVGSNTFLVLLDAFLQIETCRGRFSVANFRPQTPHSSRTRSRCSSVGTATGRRGGSGFGSPRAVRGTSFCFSFCFSRFRLLPTLASLAERSGSIATRDDKFKRLATFGTGPLFIQLRVTESEPTGTRRRINDGLRTIARACFWRRQTTARLASCCRKRIVSRVALRVCSFGAKIAAVGRAEVDPVRPAPTAVPSFGIASGFGQRRTARAPPHGRERRRRGVRRAGAL